MIIMEHMICCLSQCALEPALDYDVLATLATGPYSVTNGCMKTAFTLMATWKLRTWKIAHMI